MNNITWYKRDGLHLNIENSKRVIRLYDTHKYLGGIEYQNAWYEINTIVLKKYWCQAFSSIWLMYGYYDKEENKLYLQKPKHKMIGEWNGENKLERHYTDEIENDLLNFGKIFAYHLGLRFFIEDTKHDIEQHDFQENLIEIDLRKC